MERVLQRGTSEQGLNDPQRWEQVSGRGCSVPQAQSDIGYGMLLTFAYRMARSRGLEILGARVKLVRTKFLGSILAKVGTLKTSHRLVDHSF